MTASVTPGRSPSKNIIKFIGDVGIQNLNICCHYCTLRQLKISDCNLQSYDKFRFCVLQEGTLHHGALVCLRNRQPDLPKISGDTPKSEDFS